MSFGIIESLAGRIPVSKVRWDWSSRSIFTSTFWFHKGLPNNVYLWDSNNSTMTTMQTTFELAISPTNLMLRDLMECSSVVLRLSVMMVARIVSLSKFPPLVLQEEKKGLCSSSGCSIGSLLSLPWSMCDDWLFRDYASPLTTRKESRKRNLLFNIPIAIPLAPGVRLIENDESIISLQDIFGQYCKTVGMSKEDSILAHTERVRALHRTVPPLGVSFTFYD